MDVDLFANNEPHQPRRAWQVIDAARRHYVTGELFLDTNPPARVYLRDGQVYFAERTTDGGLGVRLLVEGVITREQMHNGTLHVSGVEHLGRMFERDVSIDRDAVQLCVELMTDDVLASVADETVTDVRMTMYKRHPSGVDRWLPTRVEVITHVISNPEFADPDATVNHGAPSRPKAHLSPLPTADSPTAAGQAAKVESPTAVPVVAPVPPAEWAPTPEAATPAAVAEESAPEVAVPAIEITPPNPLFASGDHRIHPAETPTTILPVIDPLDPMPLVTGLTPITPFTPFAPVTSSTPVTPDASDAPPAAPANPPTGSVPVMTPSSEPIHFDPHPTSEISLAPEAMDAIMKTGIADEVADAVRRALAAIDATPGK